MYIYYSRTTVTFGFNNTSNPISVTMDTGLRYLIVDLIAGTEL